MHLVELFLPFGDSKGSAFPQAELEAVERELTERFGGVTAYPRAPATGLWKASPRETVADDLLVCEVMVKDLDPAWWKTYRERLERMFEQERIVVRAREIELL